MENKPRIEGQVYFFVFLILVILCSILGKVVFGEKTYGLAGVSVGDYLLATPTEKAPTIVVNTPVKPPEKPIEKVPVKVTEKPKEVTIDKTIDLDRLAHAVAMAETHNCTKGYGKTHFNCHGIKSGNTYPCPGTPKGKMCKFKNTEESFIAFKVIWGKWYKTIPSHRQAVIWTGADRSNIWLKHVLHYYYQK